MDEPLKKLVEVEVISVCHCIDNISSSELFRCDLREWVANGQIVEG